MFTSTHLLRQRRFLPLFATQLLNAFNDNLFKNAMVLFVVYQVYNSEEAEAQFSAIASGLFILPFFILSALAGQLADMRDKAAIIRWVKAAEIGIMAVGGAGLLLAWQGVLTQGMAIPLMLLALFAMGVHSTFFGPIKYAILPQHLEKDEVLAGTGLVEAGTYIAILGGTILAGFVAVEAAAVLVMVTAVIGYATSRYVPPAPPMTQEDEGRFETLANLGRITGNFRGLLRPVMALPVFIFWSAGSSVTLVRNTMHRREVFYAILAISFFWTIGAVLFIQFPPLVKNVLTADRAVASLFLAIFSIGVAIGSVAINRLLKGEVSARYSAPAVIAMGLCVVGFHLTAAGWEGLPAGQLYDVGDFMRHDGNWPLLGSLLGIAIFGGMFVVPLYAFLTTTVPKSQAARTVAANNIVNSGAMVVGSLIAAGLSAVGVPIVEQVLLSAAMCLVSAWLGMRLHKAEKVALATA